MKYIVELNDVDGNHFQIEMHLPFFSFDAEVGNSTWKTLDEGFVKYHSGGCYATKEKGHVPINIFLLMNGLYGIRFFELFDDNSFINSSGKGMAEQSWVVNFKPGGFGWTLIS